MLQSVLYGLVWGKDGCGMVSQPRRRLCEGWRAFVVFWGLGCHTYSLQNGTMLAFQVNAFKQGSVRWINSMWIISSITIWWGR